MLPLVLMPVVPARVVVVLVRVAMVVAAAVVGEVVGGARRTVVVAPRAMPLPLVPPLPLPAAPAAAVVVARAEGLALGDEGRRRGVRRRVARRRRRRRCGRPWPCRAVMRRRVGRQRGRGRGRGCWACCVRASRGAVPGCSARRLLLDCCRRRWGLLLGHRGVRHGCGCMAGPRACPRHLLLRVERCRSRHRGWVVVRRVLLCRPNVQPLQLLPSQAVLCGRGRRQWHVGTCTCGARAVPAC